MAVTADEVERICEELRPRLEGARVRRVHQPLPHEIVLTLRAAEGNLLLLVSLHPRHARLHLLAGPRKNPPEPPPFGYVVRRRLEGARLEAIVATRGDRIARLGFRRGGERTDLVAELFGARAAIVLVDDRSEVLGSSRGDLAGGRTARPGETYRPPAPREASSPDSRDPGGAHDEVAAREEAAEAADRLERARAARARDLKRERKRLERLVAALEEDRKALPDADLCRLHGDALKAALDRVPRGASEVRLEAWTASGAEEVLVPLDPRRDPRQNMERWYKRARRSERAAAHLAERLGSARERLEALELEATRIRESNDLAELERPARTGRRRRPVRAAGPLRCRSADGYELIVGRSAEENEHVTFRLARGSDVWLHVRDRPGAHVVIRTPRDRPPPLETLLDAACLAVHHSSARGAAGVEVAYTQRKHVRALKGASRGTVSVSGERTLRVDPDPERLRRLYDSRPDE